MLLNLLRIETVDPEYIMSRSFHQFQAQRARPDMLKGLLPPSSSSRRDEEKCCIVHWSDKKNC